VTALAAVAYALDPGLGQMHICSAGHYPPVVASPGRPSGLAGVPAGLLIGAVPRAQRQVATLDITPGTLVCFYTDGLIERRGQAIDHGLDRLRQVVTAQPPDAACAAVMAAMVDGKPAHDDIALLIFPPPAATPAVAMATGDYELRWIGPHAVITMPAEIDATNAGQIRQALLSAASHRMAMLIIDMSETTFRDSAGVNAIIAAHKQTAATRTGLRLVATPVGRILTLTGADQLIPIYPNPQAALTRKRN
jgi:anti-anti-sigma factor